MASYLYPMKEHKKENKLDLFVHSNVFILYLNDWQIGFDDCQNMVKLIYSNSETVSYISSQKYVECVKSETLIYYRKGTVNHLII